MWRVAFIVIAVVALDVILLFVGAPELDWNMPGDGANGGPLRDPRQGRPQIVLAEVARGKQTPAAMNQRVRNVRLLVTGGLSASLFLALLLAVAPQSHERAHHDAATGHHECAVTLIATGKYQQSEAPILVSLPQPSVQWGKAPSLHPVWVAAPFLGACIFEHAPPALS